MRPPPSRTGGRWRPWRSCSWSLPFVDAAVITAAVHGPHSARSNPTHMGRGPQIPVGWPLAGQCRARARRRTSPAQLRERQPRGRDLPHPDAVIRLVAAVLNDMHDECQAGDRRYLSESSMAVLCPTPIMEPSPPSTAASRHRGSAQSPPSPRTLGSAARTGDTRPSVRGSPPLLSSQRQGRPEDQHGQGADLRSDRAGQGSPANIR